MTDKFYAAFEEKYRGSRSTIKLRLETYLPFVKPLLCFYPHGKSVDLGCGRGEWLELISAEGFDSLGIDLDDGMLEACREKDLNVKTADALEFLCSLHAESVVAITGFHIVEHLPFEVLKQLVVEAKRVLVPGGVLIFETPNPENLSVATNGFYLDPTHERPLPPELLSFLSEYYSFERCKILRLQENPVLHGQKSFNLMQVIYGVSPDYSVVYQKTGPSEIISSLNDAFKTEYGLSLYSIVSRYEDENVAGQLQKVLESSQIAYTQIKHLERVLLNLKNELHDLREAYMFKHGGVLHRLKHFIKMIVRSALNFIEHHPKARSLIIEVVDKFGVKNQVKNLVRLIKPQTSINLDAESALTNDKYLKYDTDIENVSLRTREIYADLIGVIGKKRK